MLFKIDKITFSPRKIIWFGMPSIITDDIKVKLLTKDILIIRENGKLKNIENTIKIKRDYAIYIFDIDRIVIENKDLKKNKCDIMRNLIGLIENYIPEHSFIYTKTKDCKIDFYCNKAKIKHKINDIFIKNGNIISDITLYILPIFKNKKKKYRNFLRLIFFPYILYKIELITTKSNSTKIKGYLKDLSYNGISIILFNDHELSFFKIGSKIQLNLYLSDKKNIIIKDTIIIRKIAEKKVICLNFDISDRKMITKIDSDALSNLIYEYVKNFIYLDPEN